MSPLTVCVIASAVGAYVIWGYQSLRKDLKPGEGPSFSSLLLWSIIDIIMWWSTRRAENDQTLIATYTILTVALTLIVLIKKRYGWSKTDSFVAVVALMCLVISYSTTPILAVLCGALSVASAGIPNLVKVYQNPPTKLVYLTITLFLLGPLFTVLSVYMVDGTLKDYIYPCTAIVYWCLALVFAIRNDLIVRLTSII